MSPQPFLPSASNLYFLNSARAQNAVRRKEIARPCRLTNWLFTFSVLLTIAVIFLLLNYSRLGDLFHSHVRDRPKRRLFLAAIGFSSRAVARAMAYGAYRNVAPFHYLYIRGAHIHHLVWGEVGEGSKSSSLLVSRLMSLLYGVAVLILDEFALWLKVEKGVYWTRRDFASLDAIILFGSALLIGIGAVTSSKP